MSGDDDSASYMTEEAPPSDHGIPGESQDEIIARNQQTLQMMQTTFRECAQEIRAQLNAYVVQSSKIQTEMLGRILQLSDQIQAIRDREAFCRAPTGKPGPKKKKHLKKRVKRETQTLSTTETKVSIEPV
jgi:hypothetical protein